MARNLFGLVLAASVAADLMAGTALAQQPAQPQVSVNWTDPEITDFVRNKAGAVRRALGPSDSAKLSKIQIPVLAFDGAPQVVRNALGPTAKPSTPRQIITDPGNPVWYHIVDHYGDMTVTVEGDLRVQQDLPDSTPLYEAPKAATTATGKPFISIFDEKQEEGLEGLIASYTEYRYNGVPYTVTIECTQATKKQCLQVDVIDKDRGLLKLIAANPPK